MCKCIDANKAHSQSTPHAAIGRTSLVDLADIIQFYSFFGFNFEVFFVYYFYIVKRHSFTCFMTFLNEAHSRAILFLCKF